MFTYISQQFDTENNTSMKAIPQYAVDLFTPPTFALPFLLTFQGSLRLSTAYGSPLLSVIPGGGDVKFVNFGTFPTVPFTRC